MSGIVAQNVGRPSGLIKAAEGGGGTWVEIKTLTSDGSDATLSFVDGTSDVVLDSTYPIYCFRFINMSGDTVATKFQFNLSTDGGSNYDVTKTSTLFRSYSGESIPGQYGLGYITARDLQQSTAFQDLGENIGTHADNSLVGFMYLYDPANTTFVKQFIANLHHESGTYAWNAYVAGFGNTTSAVDAIQFKMTSGDIDSGKIKLFGIKDS